MSNQKWKNNSDKQCKNTEKDESQGYQMSNQKWTNNSDKQCKNTEKDESQGYHHRTGAIYIL
jgi:hypothetical protein